MVDGEVRLQDTWLKVSVLEGSTATTTAARVELVCTGTGVVKITGQRRHSAVVGIAGAGSLAVPAVVELEDVERGVLVVVAFSMVELLTTWSTRRSSTWARRTV